jgi:hypothetical protein
MSVDMYQRSVNTLDKEIASLEQKKAGIDKDYANLQQKISNTSKSINAHTSPSSATSKYSQISNWTDQSSKKSIESAKMGQQIADKRKKRNDEYVKLQKAQSDENKKVAYKQRQMQKNYETRISELTYQLSDQVKLSTRDMVVPVRNEAVSEEYDVFVSHAWEDKESFVDEFVKSMEELGIKVWYDKTKMEWGDSMRAKIDDGLRKSKFGIAVLSPDYIAEGKYWTKTELDGLFQKESTNGKTLLPIWHNLTKKQVQEYSPMLAGKLAMTTATMIPQEIAMEMKKILDDTIEQEPTQNDTAN